MKKLKIETKRGTLLDGVLFGTDGKADTIPCNNTAEQSLFFLLSWLLLFERKFVRLYG